MSGKSRKNEKGIKKEAMTALIFRNTYLQLKIDNVV